MRILVYGGGGREHALAWKLSRSELVEKIYLYRPNPLMKRLGEEIEAIEFEEFAKKLEKRGVDIAIIGPELPLAEGIGDILRRHGIKVFGPNAREAKLESSKVFAKSFMKKYALPTARFEVIKSGDDFTKVLEDFTPPYVIKADGLAGGKGTKIIQDKNDVTSVLDDYLSGRAFKGAGRTTLIEENLEGYEISVMCLWDGDTLLPLELAHDYKRIFDGDRGENTGGMGSYSPVKLTNEEKNSIDILLSRLENALKKESLKYTGVLYVGVMLTDRGPYILEFNVRFGDPETQCVLPRLETDFGKVIMATVDGRLNELSLEWNDAPCVCLVIASDGYPQHPRTGIELSIPFEEVKGKNVFIFGAGITEDNGRYYNTGGRVLNIVSMGNDRIEKIYSFAKSVRFSAKYYRSDIGKDRRSWGE